MSEIQKFLNLVRGEGSTFFKKFKNVPMGGVGGVNPNWGMSLIFSIFYFDASPKNEAGQSRILRFDSFFLNCCK